MKWLYSLAAKSMAWFLEKRYYKLKYKNLKDEDFEHQVKLSPHTNHLIK